jgi:hypothetical protein
MHFRILQTCRITYEARLSVHKRRNPGEQAQWSHDQWTNLTFSRVENELGKKYYEKEMEIKNDNNLFIIKSFGLSNCNEPSLELSW